MGSLLVKGAQLRKTAAAVKSNTEVLKQLRGKKRERKDHSRQGNHKEGKLEKSVKVLSTEKAGVNEGV